MEGCIVNEDHVTGAVDIDPNKEGRCSEDFSEGPENVVVVVDEQDCVTSKKEHHNEEGDGTSEYSKTPKHDYQDVSKSKNLLYLVDTMLEDAHAAYIVAFVRRLAREKVLPVTLLETPISMGTIRDTILDNEEMLRGILEKDPRYQGKYFMDFEQVYSMFTIQDKYNRPGLTSPESEILEVSDNNQFDELVYYIAINHKDKYVNVVFRGSVTAKDWQADLDPQMEVMDNPIDGVKENVPKIQIHAGFHRYLLARPTIPAQKVKHPQPLSPFITACKRGNNRHLGSLVLPPTKCDFILQQVLDILDGHPGYKLYTSGHSLGAALSTLFAFQAASTQGDYIPKPVTCINFASPKVGNIHFRKTFAYMEKTGIIRNIRVVNHRDAVPRVPTRAYVNDACFVCQLRNVYIHVGIKLELKQGKGLVISYAQVFDSRHHYWCWVFRNYARLLWHIILLCCCGGFGWKTLRYHSCSQYYDLVRENTEALQQLNLDEMYQKIENGKKMSLLFQKNDED